MSSFCLFAFLRRWKMKKRAEKARIAATATPTPIPAFAPEERPEDEGDDDAGEEVLVAVAVPAVAELFVVGDAVAELLVVELLITNDALKTCSPNCVPLTRMKLKLLP